MSDESDSEFETKHKARGMRGSPSSSSTTAGPPSISRPRRRFIEDSDSDSDSSIEVQPKRKRVPRVASDADSDSSGSVIIKKSKRAIRVVSDSENDLDGDFAGSSSSQWESDMTDTESEIVPNNAQAHIDSDSSDGQSEKCPICLLPFKAQEVGTPESCDHVFCSECIQEWSKNMNTCPVDRHEYGQILVRRSINGKIVRRIPVQPPTPQNDANIVEEQTFCEICASSEREDRMLLCDGCDLGFHLECLTPPLDEVPSGAWFCNACSIASGLADNIDPEYAINLYNVQIIFDDAVVTLGRRRNGSPREVARTRRNERLRERIATNRHRTLVEDQTSDPAVQSSLHQPPSTRRAKPTKRRKCKKKRRQITHKIDKKTGETVAVKKRKLTKRKKWTKKKHSIRYKIVYEIDEKTGETVAVKKPKRAYKRRKKVQRIRRRRVVVPKTVKKRLALQLGICPPRTAAQILPDVKVQPSPDDIGTQRWRAGIPPLHLFGQRDQLDYFTGSDDEIDETMSGELLVRRMANRSDAFHRRSRIKEVALPNSVSSSSDILGDILDSQAKLHSKRTVFSLGRNGKFSMDNRGRPPNVSVVNNINGFVKQCPSTYSNEENNDNTPSSSVRRDPNCQTTANSDSASYTPTSTVENNASTSSGSNNDRDEGIQDFSQNSIYDFNADDKKKDKNKSDDISRSGTPNSESELDIYSDIETVSTSKVDDGDVKTDSSPFPNSPNNNGSDDENDSEPDMVIDTEKPQQNESEENTREETTVTSTVDSNAELKTSHQVQSAVHSTSEVQSQTVQSTNQDDDDKQIADKDNDEEVEEEEEEEDDDDDDDDSEDGCPNFSIYSKESINLAKNTDITLNDNETNEQNNQIGIISSSPAQKVDDNIISAKKDQVCSGLYSDSEDETIVRKANVQNTPFGISDIRNMTEDISEEERSYTPCLDERPLFREGIEGLDTELISDEDRNDFDESHDLKTVSDGDALEINAKESEMDFTRPEDYEEGEIVDKAKAKQQLDDAKKGKNEPDEKKKDAKKKEIKCDKAAGKENEGQNKESPSFKKLSKNNKERNYREKDTDRSKSRERKSDKDLKRDKRKEKRKEIERYDVRALIAEKPRRLKDKFGRDIRRSESHSGSRSPTPRRSLSRTRRSPSRNRRSQSKNRRSSSRPRRSLSKGRRSTSRERTRKKRGRSRNRRSPTRSRSRSIIDNRKRSRSKTKKRKRSLSRERRRDNNKSRERSNVKTKKAKSRSRHRSKSLTPRRRKEWQTRRHSREWSSSISRSRSPDKGHLTPSWTPPRLLDSNSVKPHNLTVILPNDTMKKKKEKKKKSEKKTKENERQKKRKRERTPPPSKEVFASGDNILVSVSFNKENETRDVSTTTTTTMTTTKRKKEVEEVKKSKRVKRVKKPKKVKDLSGVKPVAIIDLERSPFKELTPSPKDVIVLTDSENEENAQEKGVCDSSQQVTSPERCLTNYATGPKTPPEPQVKFTLTSKPPQLRAITNPLHEPDDIEHEEGEDDEEVHEEIDDRIDGGIHKGPNTPPEPPNSPPSSPDAYDPFEPTKSRSPTPEPMQTTQSNCTDLDDNREDSNMETNEIDKANVSSINQTPDAFKSHTPPLLADVQPADSQSSIHATPESNLGKSPERNVAGTVINPINQNQIIVTKPPVQQSTPFSSVSTPLITSTPTSSSSNMSNSRINILNSTILTPSSAMQQQQQQQQQQRVVLPNVVKSSPVKVSPTKAAVVKSVPAKLAPIQKAAKKASSRGNQNGGGDGSDLINFDSPYSPGSSDYEDLFEPPAETSVKAVAAATVGATSAPAAALAKPASNKPVVKSPAKIQNSFDALFGSPFNKVKTSQQASKNDNKTNSNKFNKKTPVNSKDAKQCGVKLDEENLKILDELPNSAVEMHVKDKFLKKLNRQERVVEEVKLVLKPHYNKKHINKEEYKDILRRAVPKICHNKSGEINPTKIKNLIEAYVKKVRHSKKVTSSSSVNSQKA